MKKSNIISKEYIFSEDESNITKLKTIVASKFNDSEQLHVIQKYDHTVISRLENIKRMSFVFNKLKENVRIEITFSSLADSTIGDRHMDSMRTFYRNNSFNFPIFIDSIGDIIIPDINKLNNIDLYNIYKQIKSISIE